MATPLLVLNWKAHPDTLVDAKKIFTTTAALASRTRGARVLVLPPTAYLHELKRGYKGKRVTFGVQDVSRYGSGAHTGHVTASMGKSVGATYALIGHSERRKQGETIHDFREKLARALETGLIPILCVGEDDRSQANHFTVVKEMLTALLHAVKKEDVEKMILAYEPSFAIGKNANDALTPHEVYEMAIFMRRLITEMYNRDLAREIQIIYGGSVLPENAGALIRETDIAGLLVGHASVDKNQLPGLFEAIYG